MTTSNVLKATTNAMLILSPCIHAKKSSNAFYSGTIQTNLPDGSYLVKFTDWLKFGVCHPTWPQEQLVHSVGAIEIEFPNGLVQNDNAKGPVPLSIFKAWNFMFLHSLSWDRTQEISVHLKQSLRNAKTTMPIARESNKVCCQLQIGIWKIRIPIRDHSKINMSRSLLGH